MRVKEIINSIWEEFVYGGHLLSFSISCITIAGALILGIDYTWDFFIIVYLTSQLIYSYNRYKEFSSDVISNPERSGHLKKRKKFLPAAIVVYLFLLVSLIVVYGNLESISFIFVLILLGLGYTIIFKKLTYKVIGFKNFFVAFISSLLAPFLILYFSHPLNFSVFLFSVFIFFKTFINTSFCDIKDIESDKLEGLKTLAIYFQERGFLVLLNFLTILSVVPIVLGIYLDKLPLYSAFLILTIFYNFFYFYNYKKVSGKNEKIFSYLVDAEFYFWPLLIIFGKIFLEF